MSYAPAGAARAAARALSMLSLTTAMLAGVAAAERLAAPGDRREVFQRFMKVWAGALLRIFGFEVTVVGTVPAPRAGARLVVASHRSPIDILLMLHRFGGVVLSRADLARWPVLGLAAQRAQTIFVDRGDAWSGARAMREMRARLQERRTLIVFPEGTTHAGDEVRPFQEGAFAAARGLPVEIVPVGIAYEPGAEFVGETFTQHVGRVAARRVTRVACAIGEPRPMHGARRALARSLRDEVQALVSEARRRLP